MNYDGGKMSSYEQAGIGDYTRVQVSVSVIDLNLT